MTTSSTRIETLDNVGAATSLLCATHCASMPSIVTLLPLVGLSFLAQEQTEWILLTVSTLIGLSSLCLGFRKHRSRRALAILSVGLSLLFSGRVLEERDIAWGVGVLIIGGVIVAASHLINRAMCRACQICNLSHGPNSASYHFVEGGKS